MKTKILNCLMLLIPFNAFAHPGHESGPAAAALAGLTPVQLLGLSLLGGIGLLLAAGRLHRRRKTLRADD